MIAGFEFPDYLVMGVALAAFVVIGVRARRGIDSSDGFLLAARQLSWVGLSTSLAVIAPAAVMIAAGPNEGYWVGLKLLLVPGLLWVALPLIFWCLIPLVQNLDFDSIYEYIELRFDPTTRAAASGLFAIGQLLWLGGLVALPAAVLLPGVGLTVLVMLLVIVVGGVATAYTYLGGMRACVWTDAVQLLLVAAALVVVLVAVAGSLDEGFPQIWQVASELNRTKIVDHPFDWAEDWAAASDRYSVWSGGWNVWAAVLYLGIAALFFYVADQSTVQRFIAARDDQDMSLAYVFGGAGVTLLLPLAMYVGMGLLAVYHENAQSMMPPQWIVRSAEDPDSGRSLIEADTPLEAEHLDALLAAGTLLEPSTGEPFTDKSQLLNPRGEIRVDRLATRAPPLKGGGERLIRRGGDRTFPHFLGRHLPLGLAGLVAVGLLGVVMAAVDSGLIALATVATIDLHRREGYGEAWLARQCGKDPDELDQTDELLLCRPLVLVIGGLAAVIGLVVVAAGDPLAFLMALLGLFAGPLAGVFLLGMLSRRTTAPAATAALWLGAAVALWATFGHVAAGGVLAPTWPFGGPLSVFWPMSFGFAATVLLGLVVSLFAGTRKTKKELSGLVLGLGRWGVLLEGEKDEIYLVETKPPSERESPWR